MTTEQALCPECGGTGEVGTHSIEDFVEYGDKRPCPSCVSTEQALRTELDYWRARAALAEADADRLHKAHRCARYDCDECRAARAAHDEAVAQR